MKFKRVLLKITGEAFCKPGSFGIDQEVLGHLADEIKEGSSIGIEIAIVIGGGNIFRGAGASLAGMDRVTADYIGMLATMINGMSLQDALERAGSDTRLMSPVNIPQFAEPYVRRRALRHLEKGRTIIFAGGTGNPYFTTDTAASLRAIEINADAILKATKVDGVYDSDPMKNKNARKFNELKFMDILKSSLKVMDATAVSLCMDNKLPIVVFNLMEKGNLKRVIQGEDIGTIIRGD